MMLAVSHWSPLFPRMCQLSVQVKFLKSHYLEGDLTTELAGSSDSHCVYHGFKLVLSQMILIMETGMDKMTWVTL